MPARVPTRRATIRRATEALRELSPPPCPHARLLIAAVTDAIYGEELRMTQAVLVITLSDGQQVPIRAEWPTRHA